MSGPRSSVEILRDIVAEHYDLGDVQTPEPLADAHQRRHRKLVVRTSNGDFLVKTYSNDPLVLDSLRFQHRLSDHLERNGLPVAIIQPARNGKRIVEIDTWALELQQFVRGHSMAVNKTSLVASSRALGRFHVVCRDVPHPRRDTIMWRFSEVPRESFAKLYRQALEDGEPARVDDACNRIALFLRDAGAALALEKRRNFETGLIHGDWHSGNLLFDGDRLCAILDLEFAGEGCYLEDLAYAISNLCVRTAIDPARLALRTNILLDNYQAFRTLSIYEEIALYYAVGVKHVATVSYQLRPEQRQLAGYDAAEWMHRLAVQCDWLEKKARAVRGAH